MSAQQSDRRGGGTRLVIIDGLRISAALMVAVYHYTSHETASQKIWGIPRDRAFPGLSDVFKYGWLGVELFFMISGFVICMSSWGRSPAQFARSRIVRLFPAYWPAVLITALVVTIWPWVRGRPDIDDVLVNLTMLNVPAGVGYIDPVYWTLWAETRFYLLFALVLLFRGLTLPRTITFGYGWLLCALLTVGAKLPLLDAIFQPMYAPYFVAGIAFYLIHRFGPDIRLWGLVGLSYALAAHSVTRITEHRHLNPATGIALITGYFLVLGLIALGYASWIRWRWLTTAGLLTYPFYLLHEYIGWTIIKGARDVAPRYVVALTTLALMLLAARVLHHVAEKPIASWLKEKLEAAATRVDPALDRKTEPSAEIPVPAAEPWNAPTTEIPGSRPGGNLFRQPQPTRQ